MARQTLLSLFLHTGRHWYKQCDHIIRHNAFFYQLGKTLEDSQLSNENISRDKSNDKVISTSRHADIPIAITASYIVVAGCVPKMSSYPLLD